VNALLQLGDVLFAPLHPRAKVVRCTQDAGHLVHGTGQLRDGGRRVYLGFDDAA